MVAEDFTIGGERASRLDVVKQVTQKFIDERPNDRIGMVAFAGRPYLVSPLTLDHDWLLQNLERVRLGLVEDGTAIGSAIASCTNRLIERKDSKSRIVVLLTDGDSNSGKVSPLTAAEAARDRMRTRLESSAKERVALRGCRQLIQKLAVRLLVREYQSVSSGLRQTSAVLALVEAHASPFA